MDLRETLTVIRARILTRVPTLTRVRTPTLGPTLTRTHTPATLMDTRPLAIRSVTRATGDRRLRLTTFRTTELPKADANL